MGTVLVQTITQQTDMSEQQHGLKDNSTVLCKATYN